MAVDECEKQLVSGASGRTILRLYNGECDGLMDEKDKAWSGRKIAAIKIAKGAVPVLQMHKSYTRVTQGQVADCAQEKSSGGYSGSATSTGYRALDGVAFLYFPLPLSNEWTSNCANQ